MGQITIEHNPTPMKLETMFVFDWPTRSKEVSTFTRTYSTREKCYLIEGEAIVTPDDGEPVTIKELDLVDFSAGLSCTWKVIKPIKKYYRID